MSSKSFLDRLKQQPDLDKKAFLALVGLLVLYVLYYLVLFLAPSLLHLDVEPYFYRNTFSYVIIAGIVLASIALPYATKYSNRKKRYVVFAFVTLFLLLPLLIVFESFIRIDWSFGK
jgi:hypothetical protein